MFTLRSSDVLPTTFHFVSKCYSSTARKRQNTSLDVSSWLLQHFLHVSSTCIKLQAASRRTKWHRCILLFPPLNPHSTIAARFVWQPWAGSELSHPRTSTWPFAEWGNFLHLSSQCWISVLIRFISYISEKQNTSVEPSSHVIQHVFPSHYRVLIASPRIFVTQTSCKEHKKPWSYGPSDRTYPRGRFRIFTCQRSARHLWDIIT